MKHKYYPFTPPFFWFDIIPKISKYGTNFWMDNFYIDKYDEEIDKRILRTFFKVNTRYYLIEIVDRVLTIKENISNDRHVLNINNYHKIEDAYDIRYIIFMILVILKVNDRIFKFEIDYDCCLDYIFEEMKVFKFMLYLLGYRKYNSEEYIKIKIFDRRKISRFKRRWNI